VYTGQHRYFEAECPSLVLDLGDSARMFALVSMATADAIIAYAPLRPREQ
jgi:hypothetical protein